MVVEHVGFGVKVSRGGDCFEDAGELLEHGEELEESLARPSVRLPGPPTATGHIDMSRLAVMLYIGYPLIRYRS